MRIKKLIHREKEMKKTAKQAMGQSHEPEDHYVWQQEAK